jgi:alkylation response protein AidB-like acyl-CoA dehydrogenase
VTTISLDVVSKARELTAALSELAPANEAHGSLTPATVDLLRESGLSELWVPACFGGAEASPLEGLEAIEAVAYADAAAGWVLFAWQLATATAAAYLPRESAEALFGHTTPLMAGSGAPTGRAVVDGDGYRLTGHWRYGSGLLNSSYAHSGAIVCDGDVPRSRPGTSAPEVITLITPIEQLELLGGWDGVLGLRATASVDYSMTDVYVPRERTHAHLANVAVNGGELYRLGVFGMVTIVHSAWALGVGRRALDEIGAFACAEPTRSPLIGARGGNDGFRERYAEAEATLRAARAFVLSAQADIETTIMDGEPMSTRQVSLVRLALNHATSTVAGLGKMAYLYGGGTSLRPGVLQRCFRDIFTGTQHFSTAPNVLRDVTSELLGIMPEKTWGAVGLVDA